MFMATGICSAPARRWKRSRFEESAPLVRFSSSVSAYDEKSPTDSSISLGMTRKAVNPRLRFRCELGGDDACGDQSQSGASCFFSRRS
jgi:hypothetical protein